MSRSSAWPELTPAHEIGYFLDHQVIGTARRYDYNDPIWADFTKAAWESEAIKALQAMPRSDRRDYYLRPWEIWARAYAQWVATRSGHPKMREGLDLLRSLSGPPGQSQWDDADFEPIAAAIDAMFTKLGWMK